MHTDTTQALDARLRYLLEDVRGGRTETEEAVFLLRALVVMSFMKGRTAGLRRTQKSATEAALPTV